MPIDINFSKTTEPRLFTSDLASYVSDPQVVNFGAIMICRHGKACVRVNFDEWQLYEGAVLTLFPGDVVSLVQYCEFGVEMLQYDAVMLREASLQLEQTVYEQLREDRCRQDSPLLPILSTPCFVFYTSTSIRWAVSALPSLCCYSSRRSSSDFMSICNEPLRYIVKTIVRHVCDNCSIGL